MKTLVRKTAVTGAILGLALIGPALAQEAGMKMDSMKDMDMSGMSCCGDMAPGWSAWARRATRRFLQRSMIRRRFSGWPAIRHRSHSDEDA